MIKLVFNNLRRFTGFFRYQNASRVDRTTSVLTRHFRLGFAISSGSSQLALQVKE